MERTLSQQNVPMSEFPSHPSEEEVQPNTPKETPRRPRWEKPNLSVEMEEMERTAEVLEIAQEVLLRAYEKAELEELSDADWNGMQNADSSDTSWTPEDVREHLKGNRDFERIEQGMRAGETLPAPIVLYRENESPYLIGGNSRLLGCRIVGIRPMVLALRLEQGNAKNEAYTQDV